MKAIWNGTDIAERNDTLVVEGNHYFPDNAWKRGFAVSSSRRSSCTWKGQLRRFSLFVNGGFNLMHVVLPRALVAAAEI